MHTNNKISSFYFGENFKNSCNFRLITLSVERCILKLFENGF